MANPAEGASAPTIHAAYKAVSSAYDLSTLNKGGFYQLAALFGAIAKQSSQYSDVQRLAELGNYLCTDWANSHESSIGELEHLFDTLRGWVNAGQEASHA